MSTTKEIKIKFTDVTLFSGSSDTMRQVLGGGYWQIKDKSDDTGQFIEFTYPEPFTTNFYGADGIKYRRSTVDDSGPLATMFTRTKYNDIPISMSVSPDIVAKNYKYPMRMIGNIDFVQDDLHWRCLMAGGTHKGVVYPGIFTEKEFQDYNFDYKAPYSKKAEKLITSGDIEDVVKIEYKYKFYLPLYEDYIKNRSELLIPNAYMMTTFSDSDDETTTFEFETDEYPTGVENFVWDFITRERKINPNPLLDSTFTDDPTKGGSFTPFTDDGGALIENPSELEYPSKNLNEYLTSSIIQNPLSSETENMITYSLQNMFFDENANRRYIKEQPFGTAGVPKFPFYININVPVDNGHAAAKRADDNSGRDAGILDDFAAGILDRKTLFPLTHTITHNDYTRKFLKVLKETFVDGISEVPVYNHSYAKTTEYVSGSTHGRNYDVEQTSNTIVRCCEFSDLLLYSYKDYTSFQNNFYFVGDKTNLNDVVKDEIGVYRYMNTDNALLLMKTYLEMLRNDYETLSGLNPTPDYVNFCKQAAKSKNYETLAYRIQKIAQNPSPIDSSRSELQNFFFINSEELDPLRGGRGLEFVDNQVKYGEDYVYVIYAYVAVTGYRYKHDDLKLTRVIGSVLTDEGTVSKYCLEYYDPLSLKAKGSDFQLTDDMSNEFRTSAQILDTNQYMADFHFNLQPSTRIKEIPIYAKRIRVQDNPSTILDVSPFQVLDDSKRIGFLINYESQVQSTYPISIQQSDDDRRESYLESNDMYIHEKITPEPVSRIRYFQVFRTESKPSSYRDFDDKLHHVIDLRIENTNHTYSSENFYDKIKTNKKYYYLFRAVTEQQTVGHVSEVYVAELVDDGGYKYAVFNTLYEDDLTEDLYINPSKKFKKLLHIEPNLSQIALNTENIDFNQDAHSQLSKLKIGTAEDLIWDRTFKLRLTSKKTNKKVDLNITYNLNSE